LIPKKLDVLAHLVAQSSLLSANTMNLGNIIIYLKREEDFSHG